MAFFDVEESELPFPRAGKAPELRADQRGKLHGTVISVVARRDFAPSFFAWYASFVQRTVLANSLSDSSAIDALAVEARADLEVLWNSLDSAFRANPIRSSAFVRANVEISRTGQTTIVINPREVYSSEAAKFAQLSSDDEKSLSQDGAISEAWSVAARQIFHFVRDLAHRHYHHHPRADLATTCYPTTGTDDELWRRETQYRLMRMAIASRREDGVEGYRQALGIIAYADSFQRHLASWHEVNGKSFLRKEYFEYDFTALRHSISASLEGLSTTMHSTREARSLYFVTGLTTLAIVLAGAQVLKLDEAQMGCLNRIASCRTGGETFWSAIHLLINHPWEGLIGVPFLSLLVAVSTRRLFRRNGPIAAFRSGSARLVDALMGEIARRTNALTAWTGGVIVLFASSILLSVISLLAIVLYFYVRRIALNIH